MADEKDPKEKNIVNPNDNFKNIISSYLLSQMNQDKDDPSKKPNNTALQSSTVDLLKSAMQSNTNPPPV